MRIIFTIFLSFVSVYLLSQIPNGYYDSAVGKTEAALKTQLCAIVGPHTERTYANLWTDFQATDKRADGKVWDIYSATTNYVFVTNQCGNYSAEGSCYNREHSFPKSWFNDATPMYTDLFHLYPSDGYVNGKRSNYPFGEVGTVTYASNNNFCKLGSSSFSGYSGTVFEPNDSLKGDFARTYFYMVTAYDDKVASWSSDQLAGNQYPALSTWSVTMFLKWNSQDPVSAKEINRNNAVYGIQNNRNPFIDHPELAEYIWGSHKGDPWSLTSGVESPITKSTVYWNSDSRQIIIETTDQNIKCRLFNLNGILLLENTFSDNITIDTSTLKAGVYLVELSDNQKKTVRKLIVSN
jgi:endonuclease I